MKNKSFTLIELLVVIVIIGVLAGVIMVTTTSSVSNATLARAKAFSASLENNTSSEIYSGWTFNNLSQGAGTALPANTSIEDEWGVFDGLSKNDPVVRDANDCIKGKCLQFTSDWIEIPNFTIGNETTISFWGKNSYYSGSMTFSFNGDNYTYGPDLYFTGNNINWNTGDGNNNYIVNTGLPNANWHHFVLVNDQTNGAKLYIDGEKVGRTASYKSNLTTVNTVFYIGRYDYSSSYYFNGLIDEFLIYDTPLSIAQIKQEYVAGLNSMLANGNISNEKYNAKINQLSQK